MNAKQTDTKSHTFAEVTDTLRTVVALPRLTLNLSTCPPCVPLIVRLLVWEDPNAPDGGSVINAKAKRVKKHT